MKSPLTSHCQELLKTRIRKLGSLLWFVCDSHSAVYTVRPCARLSNKQSLLRAKVTIYVLSHQIADVVCRSCQFQSQISQKTLVFVILPPEFLVQFLVPLVNFVELSGSYQPITTPQWFAVTGKYLPKVVKNQAKVLKSVVQLLIPWRMTLAGTAPVNGGESKDFPIPIRCHRRGIARNNQVREVIPVVQPCQIRPLFTAMDQVYFIIQLLFLVKAKRLPNPDNVFVLDSVQFFDGVLIWLVVDNLVVISAKENQVVKEIALGQWHRIEATGTLCRDSPHQLCSITAPGTEGLSDKPSSSKSCFLQIEQTPPDRPQSIFRVLSVIALPLVSLHYDLDAFIQQFQQVVLQTVVRRI